MFNVELRDKELAMKKFKYRVFFGVGLLAMVGLSGCNQETPVEKTKAAAASGNAATQAAGQAAVDAIKIPMDKARQAEGILEKSAEQTAAKIKESTP
jgi:cytochrome bd-type quinol oxidase subunit 1